MPHMANLPWLPAYFLTMTILIIMFSNLKISYTLKQSSLLPSSKSLALKKWTW